MRLTDGYESSIEVLWRASDLVECLIFFGLALLLVHTVFVTVRFFRRYFLGRRTSFVLFADCTPSPDRGKKSLVADLSRGVGTLRSIAFAAPFLGLAGTCYGILCLFSRGRIGPRANLIAAISSELSTAVVATAAGLIVAIPAAISYNILRTCLEKFESRRSSTLLEATPRSYGFAQTLPLRKRFSGMPAFALIGVPFMAILIPFFALFERYDIPRGLAVHIMPVHNMEIGVSDHDSEPIIVSVVGRKASFPVLYVNSKEIQWDELDSTLRSRLKARPHWTVYVEGGSDVPWTLVAYAIDVARGLHADVVLLTVAPNIGSDRARDGRNKRKVNDVIQSSKQAGKN